MVQQQPPSIKGEAKDKLDSLNQTSWHNKKEPGTQEFLADIGQNKTYMDKYSWK